MSSRPKINPFSVITNGSMATSLTSKATVIDNISLISYSITWSGTAPVGAVSVQVSNDYTQNADGSVRNAGTWNTLPLSASTAVTGNTGNGFIDIDLTAGNALRLLYTRTSGTGTLNVVVAAKVT